MLTNPTTPSFANANRPRTSQQKTADRLATPIRLAELMVRILVILIIQQSPAQIANRYRASAKISCRTTAGLSVEFRRDFRRTVRERVRLRVDLRQVPGAHLHIAQAIRRRAARGCIHNRLTALRRMRSLRAQIGAFQKDRTGRLPVEELLVLEVEIFRLLLRIVECVGDVRRLVVPESRALAVLAIAFAAARGPVQSSAIAGEGVNVGIDLASNNNVADLVGLRYDIGVERLETLIDYRVEVGNLA